LGGWDQEDGGCRQVVWENPPPPVCKITKAKWTTGALQAWSPESKPSSSKKKKQTSESPRALVKHKQYKASPRTLIQVDSGMTRNLPCNKFPALPLLRKCLPLLPHLCLLPGTVSLPRFPLPVHLHKANGFSNKSSLTDFSA
jgi:hypothetical protein